MTSAIEPSRFSPLRLALAVAFLVAVVVFAWLSFGHISMTLVVAAGIGAYMAMNIGANDVANNVGPAVGARAMIMEIVEQTSELQSLMRISYAVFCLKKKITKQEIKI